MPNFEKVFAQKVNTAGLTQVRLGLPPPPSLLIQNPISSDSFVMLHSPRQTDFLYKWDPG